MSVASRAAGSDVLRRELKAAQEELSEARLDVNAYGQEAWDYKIGEAQAQESERQMACELAESGPTSHPAATPARASFQIGRLPRSDAPELPGMFDRCTSILTPPTTQRSGPHPGQGIGVTMRSLLSTGDTNQDPTRQATAVDDDGSSSSDGASKARIENRCRSSCLILSLKRADSGSGSST